MSNYEMPKCPMGHEMELLQVASGGWRYGCAKCATSYKLRRKTSCGWLSPIKSTKERAYEAAVKRPMQNPLTPEELQNDSQVKKALQDNGFQTFEELMQAFSQVKRERDAAVADLADIQECSTCKHDPDDPIDYRPGVCFECCTTKCNYEWRGVPEPSKEET